jgi:hypothetical protein
MKVQRSSTPGDMHMGHKLLYLLKEELFKMTVTDIRELRATLSMLLSCIQR